MKYSYFFLLFSISGKCFQKVSCNNYLRSIFERYLNFSLDGFLILLKKIQKNEFKISL